MSSYHAAGLMFAALLMGIMAKFGLTPKKYTLAHGIPIVHPPTHVPREVGTTRVRGVIHSLGIPLGLP